MESALRARLEAFPPAARAELLHVLRLPDFERADRIGEFWGNPETRTFGELLIDVEEDKAARAVVSGLVAEQPPNRRPAVARVRAGALPQITRLAHSLDRVPTELGELVEEQHPMMQQRAMMYPETVKDLGPFFQCEKGEDGPGPEVDSHPLTNAI
jgi:hypothetical protein